MSDAVPGTTVPPRSPRLAMVVFGTLPFLAAVGPLLTVFRGLFAFRVACALIIVHAVLFLMGHERWRGADVWLAATTVSFGVAGLLGLGFIAPGSQDPYSELLSIVLGLGTALAARAWQRHAPGIYLALARGWVMASLFTCAVAAGEILTGIHLPGYVVSAAPDPAATFGNPNAFAIFLVMANVWAIPVRRAGGSLWRVSAWVLALVSAPLLYTTGARLALVVWLLVIAWSVWLYIRRSRNGMATMGGSLLPFVAAVGVVIMVPILLNYGTEISTSGSSGSVREQLTRQGLGFSVEQRGLPSWPGSFESLMTDRGDLVSTAGLVNAHNTWVELLVQYGALSLLLLLGWLVACACARSAAREEGALAVITLLLLGIVDSSSLDDASLWMFVITLAVAARTYPPSPLRASAAVTVRRQSEAAHQ